MSKTENKTYILNRDVNYNNVHYTAGAEVEIDEASAKDLIANGAINANGKALKSTPKAPLNGSENNEPEGDEDEDADEEEVPAKPLTAAQKKAAEKAAKAKADAGEEGEEDEGADL